MGILPVCKCNETAISCFMYITITHDSSVAGALWGTGAGVQLTPWVKTKSSLILTVGRRQDADYRKLTHHCTQPPFAVLKQCPITPVIVSQGQQSFACQEKMTWLFILACFVRVTIRCVFLMSTETS